MNKKEKFFVFFQCPAIYPLQKCNFGVYWFFVALSAVVSCFHRLVKRYEILQCKNRIFCCCTEVIMKESIRNSGMKPGLP